MLHVYPEESTPNKPDSSLNKSAPSIEELEKSVLSLVDDYYLAINKIGISDEEQAAVDRLWKEKLEVLGVRHTNNMPQWFANGPGPFNAYNLDSVNPLQDKPWVKYLKELRQSDPDFFEACRLAEKENSILHKKWMENGYKEENEDHIIARWKLDLRMTEAFKKMLTYPGATEEILDELAR